MRRVAAKFVPKLLNCDQKQHRMNIANEMLDSVRDDPNLLQRVITGDEAWVYGYDVETKAQSSQWKLPHEPRPKKARQVRSNVKVLLTVFFDCRGVVHHEFLPQGRTVNKEYYLQVMRNLREAIRQKRPDLWKNKNWLLHHDNAPAHTSLLVRDFLAKNNTVMMPQPPYSPDLAPCDFFLFPKLKRPMKGRRYATLDEIKTASKEELKKIFKNDFFEVLRRLEKPLAHKCIISHGDYFEGDKIERAGLIYEVKCEKCDQRYVGQTSRTLKERMENHKYALKAWLIRDTMCKMTSTLINTPLEKLNDQNYRSWKYNTKMMLIERELWKYVTEPTPDEEASRTIFNMKQEKALAMIALTISPSQQIHIMDCTTAREAWDTLEQVYEPKSRSRILQLKKQFISIRFEEQETMTNYLGRLKICSDHLREAGAEMQDQDLAYSMHAGLPESYDGIIMTFSNVEDKEFTSSKVKHVLLAEYERRMARRVNNTNEALQFGTTTRKEDKKKKNFTCYKCGKEGHIARSCRGKAKTPTPNFQPPRCSTHEIAGSEMLTALSCTIPDNFWVIDSGATHHVCNKREWFTNFQGITSDPILTASGTTRAEGCGDIKFKAYVGKHHVDLKLCNVLYVPNVRRNLLSVSSMENKGKIVNFANRRAQVFDSENRIVAIAHDENGLYVMKELWHKRFCHVNNDAIERMAKGELVKGLEISSMDRSLCDDCCVAKSTKEPHKPIRNIRSKRPLELVHTDICGPMPVRSIGGSAYFLTFIDDYSRKITLFCLKHKNEVLKHFDSYLARAERETGHKLKVLRSDNGLEYCNHEFKTRLEQLGIKHELTNTYSPPMNGVAERANRVLLDITRSCLHSADLPQRFWAEAVNTAAYIRNKCYNSALGDKVPDELWSSRKPSVRHLKAFGCLAYSHIPTERRKKLDNRANRCILVGYSSQTKGYCLWCPETQHVIQTKHVKFDESKIGLKWTKVEDEPERYNHIWIEPDNQLEGDIDLKPEAERERNDDTSDQDLVGVNNDDIVQTRPKRIVRNPYGRAGKPKAELHFLDII
ncbi:hypothetical protein LAZ67_6002891 [Cordylochernes scorpioides]|uniref:Retrovirus-related Pol polyprotein from transposon TNT 1-94 n=1 Tax=Cordylochernes scorpioides TaxID=51811 RepID=A0ABY6KM10_9ARAC|nr:hypothetical protein LAZ67_6002891 [Cordylochernes scorpioides]